MANTFDRDKLSREDYKLLAAVKLSVYRALLEEVIPSMRAILISWHQGDEDVQIDFYHDGAITDRIKSHYSSIMAEVCGDSWCYNNKSIGCDYDIISLSYSKPLPISDYAAVAYFRKEPFEDPKDAENQQSG